MEKNIFDLEPVVIDLISRLPNGMLSSCSRAELGGAVYICEQLSRIYSAMRDKLFDDYVRDTVEPPVDPE